jgi:hypothetical protein
MMDWYSNYPGPSKEEAIKEVVNITGSEEIVRKVIMGMESLGSETGWYCGFRGDVIKEVNKIKEEEKETNRILRIITGDKTFTY